MIRNVLFVARFILALPLLVLIYLHNLVTG